uniref:Uncharacterized protein n=1 Tax=Canis lupus familiaris TaxID=9615 RepID=A0A8C0RJ36_CANLF
MRVTGHTAAWCCPRPNRSRGASSCVTPEMTLPSSLSLSQVGRPLGCPAQHLARSRCPWIGARPKSCAGKREG